MVNLLTIRALYLLSFISISISTLGQLDTLYKMNGEELLVQVNEITESSIKFNYYNESFFVTIPKSDVSKIHFKSGRVQSYSSSLNLSAIESCLNWEDVQISIIESEVVGLQKIDIIGAKAKGATTLSSLSKLQDRAYDKIKIETAMLGGNVAYIVSQNTEDAIYGNGNSSSKTASVTISGLAYTSNQVFKHQISFGDYVITKAYKLQTNAYTIKEIDGSPQAVAFSENDLNDENGFQKVNLQVFSIPKVKDYTIIYADDNKLVLSGIRTTKKGKTTYYNVVLEK